MKEGLQTEHDIRIMNREEVKSIKISPARKKGTFNDPELREDILQLRYTKIKPNLGLPPTKTIIVKRAPRTTKDLTEDLKVDRSKDYGVRYFRIKANATVNIAQEIQELPALKFTRIKGKQKPTKSKPETTEKQEPITITVPETPPQTVKYVKIKGNFPTKAPRKDTLKSVAKSKKQEFPDEDDLLSKAVPVASVILRYVKIKAKALAAQLQAVSKDIKPEPDQVQKSKVKNKRQAKLPKSEDTKDELVKTESKKYQEERIPIALRFTKIKRKKQEKRPGSEVLKDIPVNETEKQKEKEKPSALRFTKIKGKKQDTEKRSEVKNDIFLL